MTKPENKAEALTARIDDLIQSTLEHIGDGYYDTPLTHLLRDCRSALAPQDLMDSDYARDIMHVVPAPVNWFPQATRVPPPVKAAAVDGEEAAEALVMGVFQATRANVLLNDPTVKHLYEELVRSVAAILSSPPVVDVSLAQLNGAIYRVGVLAHDFEVASGPLGMREPYETSGEGAASTARDLRIVLAALASQNAVEGETLQSRVQPWMMACFGPEISRDRVERGDRLLEEVFELLQSGGYDPARVLALRDYVWGREPGDPFQEAGGVMITMAAYCLAHDIDMDKAGETELARIWTMVDKIRAKQASKPQGSALPIAVNE